MFSRGGPPTEADALPVILRTEADPWCAISFHCRQGFLRNKDDQRSADKSSAAPTMSEIGIRVLSDILVVESRHIGGETEPTRSCFGKTLS